jgi:thiamine monophosphate synthase
MTTTSWTIDDIKKLEAAIAKGARVVQYEDKKVEYRTLDEMKRILDMMRQSVGVTPSPRGLRRVASTNKGF